MKKLIALIALLALMATPTLDSMAKGSHPRSHSSSKKTVHVHGYTTKSGKHVAAYTRRPAGSVSHKSSRRRK